MIWLTNGSQEKRKKFKADHDTFSGIFITIMKNLLEGQTFRREDDDCIMIDDWVKASKNHSKKGLIEIDCELPA